MGLRGFASSPPGPARPEAIIATDGVVKDYVLGPHVVHALRGVSVAVSYTHLTLPTIYSV